MSSCSPAATRTSASSATPTSACRRARWSTTPDGPVPIEQVAIGDVVIGAPAGTPSRSRARSSTSTRAATTATSSQITRRRSRRCSATPAPSRARAARAAGRHLARLPDVPRRPRLAHRPHDRCPAAGRRASCSTACSSARNQEHADAAWILKVCDSMAEAAYFESFFAAEYGLPTACFHDIGRELAMDDAWLQRLYESIDTETRAKLLMEDRLLQREFPHHRPQNGARRSTSTSRCSPIAEPRSATTGCSGRRTAPTSPSACARRGTRSAPASIDRCATRPSWKDYRAMRSPTRSGSRASAGSTSGGGMATTAPIYDLMPFAHVLPGMEVLVERDGRFDAARRRRRRVRAVLGAGVRPRGRRHAHVRRQRRARAQQRVPISRGRLPEHPAVRGGVPRRHHGRARPELPRTQTILDAANAVIDNNAERKPKSLWTDTGLRRPHRPLPRRGRGRRGHVGRRHRPAAPRATTPPTGARWPCSTAPTPRAE